LSMKAGLRAKEKDVTPLTLDATKS